MRPHHPWRRHVPLPTFTSSSSIPPPATFPALLGVPRWVTIGPVAYLHTDRPASGEPVGLGHFIDFERFIEEGVEPNLDLMATNPLRVPRSMAFETADERAAVVKRWLTRLLLDMGLGGEDRVALL